MKFSSMMLYVEDEFPKKETFDKLSTLGSYRYRKGNYLYSIEQSWISDSCYWMYFQYDNENLYTKTVVDTTDDSEKENPRPKTQVELRYQLFACYNIEQKLLYVSDYSKKSTIVDYIGDMLQVPVMVKNVLTSIDSFVSAVKRLKSVTFTQRRNLITSTPDSIFQQQANLYGLDLPDRSKIKLDYGLSPIGMVGSVLQNWKYKHDRHEFEDIIIVGIDDAGLENTFNFSTTISHIDINLMRDENYRYDPDGVRLLFLASMGG